MNNKIGINIITNGIRIIEIAPISILQTNWLCIGFEPANENMGDHFHLALVHNPSIEPSTFDILAAVKTSFSGKNPLLRIHSECILGDSLHSSLCDCGEQLYKSLDLMLTEKLGIILYLRQEGRGIGLRAKLSCLAIQEGYVKGKKTSKKLSPDQANIALGYKVDERDYSILPNILAALGVSSLKLITGNPEKSSILSEAGITVTKIIDIPRSGSLTQRQVSELREKLERQYVYPSIKNRLVEQ